MNHMNGFQRNIKIGVISVSDNATHVTSAMSDKFHDIRLEVVIDNESLTITHIDVDFRKTPAGGCVNARSSVEGLAGVHIGKGLTRKFFAALGGSSGCPNLRNMLLCSLPLVLNVRAAEGMADVREMMDSIHGRLQGACAGYAEPLSP